MNAQNTFLKVQNIVNNIPLEGILETAELIAKDSNIPFLPLVVKLLKNLIKFRPAANALLGTGAQTAAFVQNVKTGNFPIKEDACDTYEESNDMHDEANEMSENAYEMSDEEKAAAAERAEILTMLDQMIEIAAEDGELSDEELGYLIDIAREVDVNEKALLAKVKMKCLQK